METIKYGSLYRENDNIRLYLPKYYDYLNDQKYHLWIPIRVKTDKVEKIYMIDTYQSYRVYGDYEKQLAQLKKYGEEEDNSWYAYRVYDYYYSAIVELNEETIKAFDFYIDLDDYRVMKNNEKDDFKDEDIVEGIKLYNEHAYPYGLTLVRKNAKIDYELKMDKLFHKIIYDELNPPYISNRSLSEINELSNKVSDTRKINVVNKLNEKLNALAKEYKEYYKELLEVDE